MEIFLPPGWKSSSRVEIFLPPGWTMFRAGGNIPSGWIFHEETREERRLQSWKMCMGFRKLICLLILLYSLILHKIVSFLRPIERLPRDISDAVL